MDKRYFPHGKGGNLNPKTTMPVGFNFNPIGPIAVDARSIINEWSEDALSTLTSDEVYVGLDIYDSENKRNMVCYWIPGDKTKYNFTGAQCLWQSDTDNSVEWVDVSTYIPEDTMEEKIYQAEQGKWRYMISSDNPANTAYWGLYNFDLLPEVSIEEMLEDDEVFNDVLTSLITNNGNAEYLNGTAAKFKFNTAYKSLVSGIAAPEGAENGNFIVFVPSTFMKEVSHVRINGNEYEAHEVFNDDLEYMEMVEKDYGTIYVKSGVAFKAYAINEKLDRSMLSSVSIEIKCR